MSSRNIPKVFLDTDVAFDIISGRVPFFETSSKMLTLVIQGNCELVISSGCLANLIYLSKDIYKLKNAEKKISTLIASSSLIHPTRSSLTQAFESSFKDKEDALQYYTAIENEIDYFITRNITDYRQHTRPALPVFLPQEFIKLASNDI